MNIDTLNAHGGFGSPRSHARLRVGERNQSRGLAPPVRTRSGHLADRPRSPLPQVHGSAFRHLLAVLRPAAARRCFGEFSCRHGAPRLPRSLRGRRHPVGPGSLRGHGPLRVSSRRRRETLPVQRAPRVSSAATPFRLGSGRARATWPERRRPHVFALFYTPTSDRTRLPAEFKHITKRRRRNLPGFPQ